MSAGPIVINQVDRYRDVIQVGWGARPPAERDAQNWFVDFHKSIERRPWGPFKTLTTFSMVYDYARDKLVTPFEWMPIQGVHPDMYDVSELSQHQLRDLLGEAMCAPCLGCVVLSFYLNRKGPWWTADSRMPSAGPGSDLSC